VEFFKTPLIFQHWGGLEIFRWGDWSAGGRDESVADSDTTVDHGRNVDEGLYSEEEEEEDEEDEEDENDEDEDEARSKVGLRKTEHKSHTRRRI